MTRLPNTRSLVSFLLEDIGSTSTTTAPPKRALKVPALKMPFGKYKGKTLPAIVAEDRRYVEWMVGDHEKKLAAGETGYPGYVIETFARLLDGKP